ncbi:hypothetical protein K438DRAFT_1993750 [Mycena galopus ATCC 62051]|nr:hypothetical protein K438DRAFT_1993750 [Mycena galopus ATCC 62051]
MNGFAHQISGMYPTLIIVIVNLRYTIQWEEADSQANTDNITAHYQHLESLLDSALATLTLIQCCATPSLFTSRTVQLTQALKHLISYTTSTIPGPTATTSSSTTPAPPTMTTTLTTEQPPRSSPPLPMPVTYAMAADTPQPVIPENPHPKEDVEMASPPPPLALPLLPQSDLPTS